MYYVGNKLLVRRRKKLKLLIKCLTLILCISFFLAGCKGTENKEVETNEKIIAVKANSLEAEAVKVAFTDAKEIKTFVTEEAAVASVENEEADYVVLDEFSAQLYVDSKRKIRVVKPLSFTTDFCAYFNKESELSNRFNSTLLECIENGEIEKIKESHKSGNGGAVVLNALSDTASTLTVGVSITGAPFCDLDENGNVVGIDVDVASLVANRMGCKIEFMVLDEENHFKALAENEADFIISGLVYDSLRAESFTASLSYVSMNYSLLERK